MSTTTTTTTTSVLKGDDRDAPLPPVPAFDRSTATVDEVVHALIYSGGCILRNTVDQASLDIIEADIRPYLDANKAWDGEFFSQQTRRVTGLATKSKMFMEKIVRDKLYQDVCDRLLSSTFKSWMGPERHTSVSKPQLHTTAIFSIRPGARAQGLHRDDMLAHNTPRRMKPEDYEYGQDTAIGFFVGGKKTTKLNGATRFIPGSHMWDPETPPDEDLAYYAELEAGDAFIMLASCFHGGSANDSENQERLVYSSFMTKGYLRQEENQYLLDKETLKEVYKDDFDMLKLIGYDLSRPFLGWFDERHPLNHLFPEEKLDDMF